MKETTKLVSDIQIENPNFLSDLRLFTSELSISPDHWLNYLVDAYRDYRGLVVFNGEEVFLNMEVFETDGIREWFRDWACAPVPEGVRPRLREESRERIRALATILSTRFPFEASMWGVRAVNDNRPPA
ncbi:hypothetical protein JCM17846_28710 [Iodidimonas nitroreducens]|uniref:Uncharacterized protein n=1 Tax=Iodidimonas nitroreducens TaxID=1236968 RepID=A0A5A7NDN6_9PROT|nr:hypothetical protein [Iodidimonas nitroreducens]GER05189.1 hypothetical protein JCM17846_28710 [Iodidimonas nitroreducens]